MIKRRSRLEKALLGRDFWQARWPIECAQRMGRYVAAVGGPMRTVCLSLCKLGYMKEGDFTGKGAGQKFHATQLGIFRMIHGMLLRDARARARRLEAE